MKLHQTYLLLTALAAFAFTACGTDETGGGETFDNKIYIEGNSKTDALPLKNSVKGATKILRTAAAKPVDRDIELVYKADESLVATYNEAFYDEAVMLPSDYYEFTETRAKLAQGTVLSTDVTVTFKDLNLLGRENVYVLPVTIESADGIAVLQSARTHYYVLRASASINVVADMEKKNYVSIPNFRDQKPSAAVCNDLRQFTLEALIRVRKFDPGIQTIMGTEGYFLLRISDNGLAPNQLQFANPYGNLSSDKCMLPANEWVHIAATYDMDAAEINVYLDGELAATKNGLNYLQPASFGAPQGLQKNDFYLGFSYEPGRELDGEISECRIWNVVRSQQEIAENRYEVEPGTPGLVAYWKFDEGSGQKVRDHSGNRNDGEAKTLIKWTPVTLPAPAE